jgi:hypothetical protein
MLEPLLTRNPRFQVPRGRSGAPPTSESRIIAVVQSGQAGRSAAQRRRLQPLLTRNLSDELQVEFHRTNRPSSHAMMRLFPRQQNSTPKKTAPPPPGPAHLPLVETRSSCGTTMQPPVSYFTPQCTALCESLSGWPHLLTALFSRKKTFFFI